MASGFINFIKKTQQILIVLNVLLVLLVLGRIYLPISGIPDNGSILNFSDLSDRNGNNSFQIQNNTYYHFTPYILNYRILNINSPNLEQYKAIVIDIRDPSSFKLVGGVNISIIDHNSQKIVYGPLITNPDHNLTIIFPECYDLFDISAVKDSFTEIVNVDNQSEIVKFSKLIGDLGISIILLFLTTILNIVTIIITRKGQ